MDLNRSLTGAGYFWVMTENTRILLADDEPDILEVLEYNLRKEGYEVKTVSNGVDAVDMAFKFRPHLIVLDVMMPEMDGIETCQQIRQIEECKDILIIFLSAQGEDYSQLAGFDAGSDDYVVKPFSVKVLVRRIRALLSRASQLH